VFPRSCAPLPFQPDLSQELKATLAKLTKLQALYKSSLKLSQSQVNLNLALSKALDASKAEIEMFKQDVHMLDDLVAAEQAKTKAAQDKSKAEVKMLVADGKTLIDRVAAEQAKAKAAQKEVELYVALLNNAEKTADANDDKYCSLLYDAETEIGTLKAEAGELKTEKSALKALLNAERLKNKTLVESLSKGLAMFEQPPLDNGLQQVAPPPDSPWDSFLNGGE
jgi:hypothetical protein